jgi:hypothetical protein
MSPRSFLLGRRPFVKISQYEIAFKTYLSLVQEGLSSALRLVVMYRILGGRRVRGSAKPAGAGRDSL